MIRAVTFDAAGTLIAPREPVGITYARAARAVGVRADPANVEAAFRGAFSTAPPLAFPGAAASDVPGLERAWWRAIVGAALGLAPGPALDACFETLFTHYAHGDAWRVYPDVRPALRTLRAAGLPLAVVSNFDGRLRALLDDLELAPAFSAIVWSTAASAAKPAPGIFAAVATALGVPATSILHIGDDPDVDVRGAEAAGFRAWHLDRRSPAATYPDLEAVVARLLA